MGHKFFTVWINPTSCCNAATPMGRQNDRCSLRSHRHLYRCRLGESTSDTLRRVIYLDVETRKRFRKEVIVGLLQPLSALGLLFLGGQSHFEGGS